jgi:AcrR family transcriptional regulator
MASRTQNAITVWERREPERKPAPGPLSRERIVRAALSLADKKGLEFVTLRKVGARLNAGPMRLYRFITTKDELLELMVDEVYGELLAIGPYHRPWRTALRAVAQRLRKVAQAHPWFVDLLGGRPHLGPNSLAHLESTLAAVSGSPGFGDIDRAVQAVLTVNAYAIGAIRLEATDLRNERATGLSTEQWQRASWAYLQRQLSTGAFPTVAKVVHEAKHPPADVAFEKGLETVLDGFSQGTAQGIAQGQSSPRV